MIISRFRRLTACLCIIVIAPQFGCATPQTMSAPTLSDGSDASLGSVALATGRFEPTVHLEAALHGKGEAAWKGAAAGAGGCIQGVGQTGGGLGAGLVLVACIPIAIVAGASKVSKAAAPKNDVQQAETSLSPAVHAQAPSMHDALIENVLQYAAEVGLASFTRLDDQGPSNIDEAPEYRLRENQNADFVIEIVLVDVSAITPGTSELAYEFALTARGRIIRVANNTVLDSFYKRAFTVRRSAGEWLADDGKLLVAELGRANREIAEAFVDEWLLIEKAPLSSTRAKPPADVAKVSDKPTSAKTSKRIVPAYMLRPIYPEPADRGFKSVAHNWPLKDIQIDNLRPTLQWEPFPRPDEFPDVSVRNGGPREVSYDLRIYRGMVVPGSRVIFYDQILPTEPVLSESGISAPFYQLPQALEPCAIYFWTVRARYLLDGRPRATEWSWPYSWQTPGQPWQYRRSWPTWSGYSVLKVPRRWPEYMPFRTPSLDGGKCSSQ